MNKNFYPTPEPVIHYMINGEDLTGKTILEPSAGSGNILDVVSDLGGSTIACENDKNLQIIARSKCDQFLKEDFMQVTADEISHVDFILMNPPFDADEKHILHAWNMSPDGCKIVALCNWETLKNKYTNDRRILSRIINDYGFSENLESVFQDSERPTGVEIGLIRLFKPAKETEDWSDYFTDEDDDQEEHGNGLIKANVVRECVQRYLHACDIFNKSVGLAIEMNSAVGVFGVKDIALAFTENEKDIKVEEFRKELQKKAWIWVFSQMKMEKFMTASLRDEINIFTQKQTKIPFTMKNIYRMLDMVAQTHGQRMDRVFLELFDKLTLHYSENRYAVEGWKTNSHYMVNQKFILNNVFETSQWTSTISAKYNGTAEMFDELTRALDHMLGTNYYGTCVKKSIDRNGNPQTSYPGFRSNHQSINAGEWYDYGHFEVKGFKKGTLHAKFKERDTWAKFNRKVAEIKGFVLPEKI